MTMMGMEMTVKNSMVIGQAYRTEVNIMGFQIITTFNGNQGWTLNTTNGNQTAQPMSQSQLAKQKASTYLNGTELVAAQDNNYPVELIGKQKQNGKDVFTLKVTRPDGVATYYVDPTTYLVVGSQVSTDNNGQRDQVNYTYNDYTTVDGITLPSSAEMSSAATNGPVTMKLSKRDLNPTIANSRFGNPQLDSTPTVVNAPISTPAVPEHAPTVATAPVSAPVVNAVGTTSDCNWREKELTITILGNDELWLNCDVTAYTCDSDGKPSDYGNYVSFKNRGKAPFYYRSSPPNTYENSNTKTSQRGTSSNVNYFEIGPGGARIVDVVDYRNQKDKYLSTRAVLNVKYCKPTDKPKQEDYTSLNEFKENQRKYMDVKSVNDCSDSYFWVFLSYRIEDSKQLTGWRYFYVTSTIFRSRTNLLESHMTFETPQHKNTDFTSFSAQHFIKNINYTIPADAMPGSICVSVMSYKTEEAAKSDWQINNGSAKSVDTTNEINNAVFELYSDAICQ